MMRGVYQLAAVAQHIPTPMRTIYGIKLCSTCGIFKLPEEMVRDISKINGRHHRCIECDRLHHAERKHDGRKEAASHTWRQRNPEKVKAHRAVAKAKSKGQLIPQACSVCGREKVQGHHGQGYDEPKWLKVDWLCDIHHNETHVAQRRGTTSQLELAFTVDNEPSQKIAQARKEELNRLALAERAREAERTRDSAKPPSSPHAPAQRNDGSENPR